jgi:hypothetical protein
LVKQVIRCSKKIMKLELSTFRRHLAFRLLFILKIFLKLFKQLHTRNRTCSPN